ncbi:sodium:solute symporter family protein [Mycobacterium sp. 21AC1]|uniref:sodium:solute symporter family protein n=1 Tax=[Mycobacterium] appelbergii TaxID=2939269 RepID=UPI002938E797|nr:sodium:solute symporter family protein [Mycobacterium sp. 21AC1]MDV3125048.1 sodium:solute symporter family protein [Mycobacterium sp. 21AC1]
MAPIDWALLTGYFALLVVIGIQTMKRIKNPDDFAVAGNRIVWPVFFGSLAAAFLGGGASIGIAGATMRDGYVYMFAFCAFGIQTVLVGLFIAPRLKNYRGAHTLGDVMDEHYGKPARIVTGVLSLALCSGILGAQALAIGTVVNATLDVPTGPAVIIGMGIVVLYSSFGGAWAVIQTDMLQFVFLGVFLPVALLIGLHAVGGPVALFDQVPVNHLTLLGDYTPLKFLTLFVALLLGETLVPPYAQRTFSTPDSRHAKIGYTMAGFFSFFFYFVSASIGLIALVLYPDIKTDEALPTVVMRLMPVGILGLVIAALLAVVMSTASSYLNSTAVVLTKDIYQPTQSAPIPPKRRLAIERTASVVVGAAATIFALSVPSIVDALLYSYALWAPTIIVPLFGAVLFGIRSAPAALSAIAAGALVTGVWQWGLDAPFGLDDGLIPGVLANLVVYTVVAAATANRYPRRRQPILAAQGESA